MENVKSLMRGLPMNSTKIDVLMIPQYIEKKTLKEHKLFICIRKTVTH